MPVKTIVCPDCGLALKVTSKAGATSFSFDFKDWLRRCKRNRRVGPVWCLMRVVGALGKKRRAH
jgi:hypothetical protein